MSSSRDHGSFELAQLREATEKYTYHDAGTHGVNRK
jgi:hypothetical protein